jgi:hypothetical protein
MVSKVDICNGALRKLGVERINSLTEDNSRAKLCNDRYEIIKKEVLRSHPWKCAIKRASLAALPSAPLFDWEKQYVLPSDCLRVLKVNDEVAQWAQEGNYVLTNDSECKIKYISDVAESLFDSSLCEVISFRLAVDLCYSITQSAPREQTLQAQYAVFLADARSFSAQSANQNELY